MKLIALFALFAFIGIYNCYAEEIALDANRLEIREEVVVIETREDYEEIIEDVDRDIATLQDIRGEAVRKLELLNVERERILGEEQAGQ